MDDARRSKAADAKRSLQLSLNGLILQRIYCVENLRERSKAQWLHLLDVRNFLHLRENFGRDDGIDFNQRDGVAALRFAAEMEGRDIDPSAGQQRRESSDESRPILIGDIEHGGAELGVDADTFDVDNARTSIGVDSTGDPTRLLVSNHRDRDQIFVIALDVPAGFLDDYSAVLCDNG